MKYLAEMHFASQELKLLQVCKAKGMEVGVRTCKAKCYTRTSVFQISMSTYEELSINLSEQAA